MDEYINKRKLISSIVDEPSTVVYEVPGTDFGTRLTLIKRQNEIVKIINDMPAEDVEPCKYDGDYVRVDDVINLIDGKCVDGCICNEEDCLIGAHGIIDEITDLPTADVEPVKHACTKTIERPYLVQCSNCENIFKIIVDDDVPVMYCPCCGAKFDIDNGEWEREMEWWRWQREWLEEREKQRMEQIKVMRNK